MSLRQKAVKGALWSGIQNWGSSLVVTVVFLVLARLLEPAAFGLVAYASIFTAFLAIFQRQGFAQAIIQRAELEAGHLDTAFWSSTVSGFLLSGIMFAAAHALARAFGQEPLGPVLRGLSVTLLIDALGNTPQAILRRDLEFKRLAVRSLGAAMFGGVIGVGMAFGGYGVWSLVGQQVAASLSGTAALWLACRWRPRFAFSVRHFRELFGFGVYAMGREILAFFNRRTDDLLIGMFLGAAPLGYYTIGRRLLLTMTRLFTQTVAAVALPTFSRLQHDHSQMRQALLTATGLTSLLAFPAFVGASVLAPELVAGLFGDGWDRSVPIMRLLALVGIVQCVNFFNSPMIVACGKPSWVFGLALGSAVAGLALYGVAVHWGIVVVAAAHVVRSYSYALFPLRLVRRLIGLNIPHYLRRYAAPLIASLVMAAAVGALKRVLAERVGLPALLVVSVGFGVVTYSLTLHAIAPGRIKEAFAYLRLAAAPGTPSES